MSTRNTRNTRSSQTCCQCGPWPANDYGKEQYTMAKPKKKQPKKVIGYNNPHIKSERMFI